MKITDFDYLRVGSGFPKCFDISAYGGQSHENYGCYATTYTFADRASNLENFVQLRKLGDRVSLCHFNSPEQMQRVLADKDHNLFGSEVIWDSRTARTKEE